MNNAEDPLLALLTRVNSGQSASALPCIDECLKKLPYHPGFLSLRAEALRLLGQTEEAISAFRLAGGFAGGIRNWIVAGILLIEVRRHDEATLCFRYALAENPDSPEALNGIISSLFNTFRLSEALPYAKRLTEVTDNRDYLSNATLLLENNGLHDEAAAVYKRIFSHGECDLSLAASAMTPLSFACEWACLESIERRLRQAYQSGQYAAAREFPAMHISWCADERHNFSVAKAHTHLFYPAGTGRSRDTSPILAHGGRIRVGYLSSDFCNHATMHLMAGVFEQHDRSRFEIFAYDYSLTDGSSWRNRFLEAVEHHIDVSQMSDAEAASRIAADHLDILIDLKGHTGMARLGILALRPARLQATYLGFPGTVGADFIDYLISDRFVTPDGSQSFYQEKLCRLPHSYQCNDDRRPIVEEGIGDRSLHGLPANRVVFCAFNQSRKIDRGSFEVWMSILKRVPKSVLWLLKQSQTAEENLRAYALSCGVDAERLLFGEFMLPEAHLGRLRLADVALDTLICNGHTTTSDALWAGVPVVTARGTHFASRVSESLLQAVGLGALVGSSREEMVEIAVKLGTDRRHRLAIQKALRTDAKKSALFDTKRFTRNFELAIGAMVSANQAGGELPLLDIHEPSNSAVMSQ